jgi:hypothetical protein
MAGIRNSKTPRPVRVFLSHSDVDMVAARKLRNLLVYRENAEVFTADDLNAGEDWLSKLREMLTSADVVVALLTPDSVRSNFVLHEIGAAWGLGKRIFPVITRRDVLNNMPASLVNSPALELADIESPENADKFLAAFESSLGAAQALKN